MRHHSVVVGVAVIFLTGALWYFWPEADIASRDSGHPTQSKTSGSTATSGSVVSNDASANTHEVSHLADGLNAPAGTIAADLQIVADLFEAFRSNFLHSGNPVGENAEITAALSGKNSLRLAIIPPNHPAIDSRGQLCDRWSTPYFFHQLSGSQMEIRSAGADRKFGSADDILFEP